MSNHSNLQLDLSAEVLKLQRDLQFWRIVAFIAAMFALMSV